jgi:hypothetical protein
LALRRKIFDDNQFNSSIAYVLSGCVPVSFALDECGGALALELSQVL